MWRWGLGRGYFRSTVSIVLVLVLAFVFAALLALRRDLYPLIQDEIEDTSLFERQNKGSVEWDSVRLLGDWLVFDAIADSCSQYTNEQSAKTTSDTLVASPLYIRKMRARLARELKRYDWNGELLRYYAITARNYIAGTEQSKRETTHRSKSTNSVVQYNLVDQPHVVDSVFVLDRFSDRIGWLDLIIEMTNPVTHTRE